MWSWVLGGVVVAIALAVLTFRQVRKRGEAEGKLELAGKHGDRDDKAAEILAEPTGDAASWSDKLHERDSG